MEKIPVTVKYDETLLKKIDQLAYENFETRSEFIRDITTEAVKRKLQMEKLQDLAINKWVEGKITADEMAKILGVDKTEKIALLRKTLRESVLDGMKIGKQLRK